ncbi:MAG TPA: uracil-DNA glycosylase [Caulobacteraceae bacterium]
MAVDMRAMESLLAFWAEAGVDACYEAAPVDRTAASRTLPRRAGARPAVVRDPAAPTSTALAPEPPVGALEALQAAREAVDLAALGLAIAAFDGCPLKFAGARQAVTWRGPADGPVMAIGEAPGAEEDAAGAPFVGRAGKLLDKMLAAAGLDGRVLITNTVFWRPPGNRDPTLAEQLACAPFLQRAIALVRPRVLLLVGGAAAKSVLGQSTGILSLRGRWFEWRSDDQEVQAPAMPTLHPAFLLRQPAAKKLAWSDLLTLAERLDRPERPS